MVRDGLLQRTQIRSQKQNRMIVAYTRAEVCTRAEVMA